MPRKKKEEALPVVNRMAAGIDIGSKEHYVAVGPECVSGAEVKIFEPSTGELERMARWLKSCGITTVAMESTGVYWVPVFDILEKAGFEVILANAQATKNVPGRKSDVMDCQWIQKLHAHGLLAASFQPGQELKTLRDFVRQRGMLVRHATSAAQRMQKALRLMNLVLETAVSSILTQTGLRIIKAILAGERDPHTLAKLRDPHCRQSVAKIAEALHGNYTPEYLFQLRQALQSYEFVEGQIRECDREIVGQLRKMQKATQGDQPKGDDADQYGEKSMAQLMEKICGTDLTMIEGVGTLAALTILAEIGTDMSRWPTEKQFCSWLALCPGIKKTGGKVVDSSTRQVKNRAAVAFRLCAAALMRSKSALGAYARRMKSRLGPAKAITAVAHKLARLVYSLLKNGREYVSIGLEAEEKRYRERKLQTMEKNARRMGYRLIKLADEPAVLPTAVPC